MSVSVPHTGGGNDPNVVCGESARAPLPPPVSVSLTNTGLDDVVDEALVNVSLPPSASVPVTDTGIDGVVDGNVANAPLSPSVFVSFTKSGIDAVV